MSYTQLLCLVASELARLERKRKEERGFRIRTEVAGAIYASGTYERVMPIIAPQASARLHYIQSYLGRSRGE